MQECEKAKHSYSTNIVNDLKQSNPSQWYSKIKQMSSHSAELNEEPVVQELLGLDDSLQVERIADQLSQVANSYSPLKDDDIDTGSICDDRPLPEINPYIIYLAIMSTKKKTSTA